MESSGGEGHLCTQVPFLLSVWGSNDEVGWEVLGCVSPTETLAGLQASCSLILPETEKVPSSQALPHCVTVGYEVEDVIRSQLFSGILV